MPNKPLSPKSKTSAQASHSKSLLPVVQKMIEQLNQLFVEFVGPVGRELVDDVFKNWIVSGKTGPSGVKRYSDELAKSIDNPAERTRFLERANQILSKLHL